MSRLLGFEYGDVVLCLVINTRSSLLQSVFQQYTAVPQTPLLTSQVLKEENEQWPEVQQEMSLALKEMRVDHEGIVIKAPGNSSSKLAKKR